MSEELHGLIKEPTTQFPFDLAIFLLVALELLFHLIHILQEVKANMNENDMVSLPILFSASQ